MQDPLCSVEEGPNVQMKKASMISKRGSQCSVEERTNVQMMRALLCSAKEGLNVQ